MEVEIFSKEVLVPVYVLNFTEYRFWGDIFQVANFNVILFLKKHHFLDSDDRWIKLNKFNPKLYAGCQFNL